MATATCAACGATAEITRGSAGLQIDIDNRAVEFRCKHRPLPAPSGRIGDPVTGCPDLDLAIRTAVPPRRTPRRIV